MTVARAWSVALVGVEGHLVEVEADLSQGLPGLHLVGLPDAALNEARDRVRAAVMNSGEAWPGQRITVGLSPATLPKAGSGFDCAVAAAVLAAANVVPQESLAKRVLLGELGLDGRVRHIRGVLPAVLAAARAGFERVVVPAADAAEAALVPGITVEAVGGLRSLLGVLRGQHAGDDAPEQGPPPEEEPTPDLADVLGQPMGRRALEVAAAGGHHVFLLGPPGAGKTMLAERLPGLLPPLDLDAALEVTAVHSVAGLLRDSSRLRTRPPYRAPHHSATLPALVGGGAGVARPGEISLAHRGVLFLDEAPEFATGVLDALRQPLESGEIRLARSGGTARYPARFQLVLAANPCPCAPATADRCECSPALRRRYLARLSGPLLDRVDLQVALLPVSRVALLGGEDVEATAPAAARVLAARARTTDRLAGTPWRTNGEVPGPELRRRWRPAPGALANAERALELGWLTARGLDRVVRVAWTLADLDGTDRPGGQHVDEALALRRSMPARASA